MMRVFISGPRACGKTRLANKIVDLLLKENPSMRVSLHDVEVGKAFIDYNPNDHVVIVTQQS